MACELPKMKLLEAQRKVLASIELDAELAAPDVAKRCGLKTSHVQRIIQGFKEDSLFDGRTAVIDTDRIGLFEYGIGIVLGDIPRERKESFFRYAEKNSAISWVAEVGGGFDLCLNILSSHPQRVELILNEVERRFPGLIQEKSICIRTRRYRFWRGYLSGKSSRQPRFTIGLTGEVLPLHQDERRILLALSDSRFESYRELARSLSMPIATFLRRVRSLKEKKILLGFGYRMNVETLGLEQYRLLLFTKGPGAEHEKRLLRFVAECPWIKVICSCLGPWSFEFEFEAFSQREARDIVSEIRQTLMGSITKTLLLPILSHRKYISFPPALEKTSPS